MTILPARNSIPGVILFYLNTLAFITFAVIAWRSHEPLPIALVIITFATLIIQDVLWFKQGNFAPQDKYLLEKLKRRFDHDKTRELLTDFDFSRYTYNTIHHLIKLEEINEKWTGVDFEFRDKHCQRLWARMQEHIRDLLDILYNKGERQNAYNHSLAHTAKPDYQGENYAAQARRHTKAIWDLYQQLRKIYISKMPYE